MTTTELPLIRDFDDAAFDPLAAESAVFGTTVNPHTPLAAARRQNPVYEGHVGEVVGDPTFGTLAKPGQREFLILGHAEAMRVAGDATTFLNGPALADNLKLTVGNSLSIMDPPVHTRLRPLFQAAFTPRMIADWSEKIVAPVIHRLLDGIAQRGRADLLAEFTHLYPFQIIYHQLGLPLEQAAVFHRLSIAVMFAGGSPTFRAYSIEASEKLRDYFTALVTSRRKAPGADLVSALVQAEVDGEGLSDDLIVSFLRQLINAGGETTFQATSSLLAALLLHPDQLAAVRADRSLVPQTIEELLRWEPPSAIQPRYVARDVEVGGVAIPGGSLVSICFGAATRDEAVFAEPEKFNIHRKKAANFGFGYGAHFCIGHHLARMEMQHALNAILDRLPNVRVDPDKPPPVIVGNTQRRPQHLHVRFG